MTPHRFTRRTVLTLPFALWSLARAQGTLRVPSAAIPTIVGSRPPLPGEHQALAPGVRRAAALPQLTLKTALPQLSRLEYRGNGFIEVAHGLILIPQGEAQTLTTAQSLALKVVNGAFEAKPDLAEVDVTVYKRQEFAGLGGPAPLFTASVPRARVADFGHYVSGRGAYERSYEGGVPVRLPPALPLLELEKQPVFSGSAAALETQRGEQAFAQIQGGIRDGLFFKGSSRRPLAALSFDDAPHPLFEPLLLDLLRRAGVRATFFCIGRNAQAYPYFVADMVRAGHEVGNHTYHHVRLPLLSAAAVTSELALASGVLSGITGKPIRFFRPPGGEYSSQTLEIAEAQGLTTVFWTDDPGDFANPGDAVLRARLERNLRPGGIVLLHDNASEALDVLEAFLRTARERKVSLSTVGILGEQSRLAGGALVPRLGSR